MIIDFDCNQFLKSNLYLVNKKTIKLVKSEKRLM